MDRKLLSKVPTSTHDRVGWPWTNVATKTSATMPNDQIWPSISIVTPSYNQALFIEETIRSVLLQGYPHLEYIVIDGGSTDGTVEILRKYEPYFSYLHIGPDGGQSAALAEGFSRATGQILAWINSDDRYRPGTLVRVAKFFNKHPSVIFGNGDVNTIDAEGQFIQRLFASRPNPFLTANLGVHGWPQQGCFWRNATYHQVGGMDSALRFCMDRDLFIRLTMMGRSKRIPGAPLADFRIHDAAKSSTILDVAEQEGRMLISKYGFNRWQANRGILQIMWRLWSKPTNLRARLNLAFGWEL